MPITPTRSGLADGGFVAEVHGAQAGARDGAGGDARLEKIAAGDADGGVGSCPWPTAFSSGLRYIDRCLSKSNAQIKLPMKKSSPAQRPTGVVASMSRANISTHWLYVGSASLDPKRLHHHDRQQEHALRPAQASRVNSPRISNSPIPRIT